jgi:hypothetical protein
MNICRYDVDLCKTEKDNLNKMESHKGIWTENECGQDGD